MQKPPPGRPVGRATVTAPHRIPRPALPFRSWVLYMVAVLSAAGLVAHDCSAQTLRVTSWNLANASETQDRSVLIEQAAATLSSLNPDVILLQGVQDWKMCEQLADSLKSGAYDVVICSAVHDTSPGVPDQMQVAILSKQKAYFSWSEAWQSPKHGPLGRGLAFAAIQAGTHRLAFFSALLSNQEPLGTPEKQILGGIDSIGQWETNQVQTFVIAASFDAAGQRSPKALRRAAAAFDHAGFVDSTEELPTEARATVRPRMNLESGVADGIFVGPMAFPIHARISATPFVDHYPTTCELELDPDKAALEREIRAEGRRDRRARIELSAEQTAYWAGGVLGFAMVIGIVIRLRVKRRRPASTPPVMGPPARVPRVTAHPPLRPIIFANSQPKSTVANPPAAALRARPVLRLQSSPKLKPEPTASLSDTAALGPEQALAREQDIAKHEKPIPHVVLSREPGVRLGVIKELSGWLKHKLVRKLVTDRARLMEAQQLATRMANTLDTRLARIEAQIQQQNQAYTHRIEELNKELAAAREENRELIRERIAQVKAEMEAARARVLAEAELDNSSLRL